MVIKARLTAVIVAAMCVLSAAISASYAISKDNIVVEIDYGGVRPSRTAEAPLLKGRTALEVLESVAKVKTNTVAGYVFVVSIDGVEGKRGDKAWYYMMDGKKSDKLASSNILNDVSRMKWEYKKDTCSEKVDKDNCCQ
ncbi:MAG: DUF4430 domain-containing protein [Candidatus Omnitrophota bacterium]|nr:DUF4430 domain-containing protein [Candidatus Omnitrophota bacterium]